jgi:hypothetical protein
VELVQEYFRAIQAGRIGYYLSYKNELFQEFE